MKKWEAPSELARYMKQGYVLNIPGGKSLDGSHASFGFKTIIGSSGKIEVLVIGFNPWFKKENKEKILYTLESSKETLCREFEEETGVRPIVLDFLGKREMPNKKDRKKIHAQYVYRIRGSDARSIIRKTPEMPWLTEPFFVPLWYLKINLFEGHQWMLSLLIQKLEKEYPEMLLN